MSHFVNDSQPVHLLTSIKSLFSVVVVLLRSHVECRYSQVLVPFPYIYPNIPSPDQSSRGLGIFLSSAHNYLGKWPEVHLSKKSFTRDLASFIQELGVSDLGERLQLSTIVSQIDLCSVDLELFVFDYLNQNIS